MTPFLERLAHLLLEKHQHELDQVAVVLPGRRAGIHLRRYLAGAAGRTIWSPEMLNMGAFLERATGLRQGDPIEMLFMLHQAHRDVRGEKAEALPEFLQWAPVTLRDMSEADSHLLDLGRLYRDLREFHEIDDWSFKLDDLSQGQQRLAQQWLATGAMHRRLHELMEQKGAGTSGWLSRKAAEATEATLRRSPWRKVWFAGLNALDPATTKLIKAMLEAGKAELAWDADRYYLEQDEQEAGRFLRRSIKDLGAGILPPVNELRERERKVISIAVPNGAAQARAAAQLLAEVPQAERERTAIVLAAENLLMPLLASLPADAGPYNVTMGMPVRSLPVHGLVTAFLRLHESHREGAGYHHKALERLLLHPFLRSPGTATLIKELRDQQRIWANDEEIVTLADKEVAPVMRQALLPVEGDVRRLQQRIISLLSWARQCVEHDAFAREQLFRMARLQQRLDEALNRSGITGIGIRSYILLRERSLREESIGFFGEPLAGVQIMGFLETRALDHTNVIVLGANDGVLPATGTTQSWIPHEIRRAHGLPMQGDPEAITAYHFHRSMQQARHVHLIHDTNGDNGSAGPSRFLQQWEHELIPVSNTTIEKRTITPPFPTRHAPLITIRKDDAVLEKLELIGRKGFSPSAIATYITCPLDLYFKYVLGIRAPDEVEEKLGSDVLGEAVHDVMEQVFQRFLGRQLQADELREWIPRIEDALVRRLGERIPVETLRTGNFRLRIEMASKAVRSYLTAEADRCEQEPTIPLLLETDVSAGLPNGMTIKGRCDRVDIRNGVPHILDVKTGSVRPPQVELRSMEREEIVADKRFALQLLMYAWAYMMEHPEVPVVRAGIIPLQKHSQAAGILLKLEGSHDIHRSKLPVMEALLTRLTNEILDPHIPFTHTTESLYCTCCIG